MPAFSQRSKDNLDTCHSDLRAVFNEAIKYIDFSVIKGHRGKEEQDKAYKQGRSNARWGQSAHNAIPSRAADIFPFPYKWDDAESFFVMRDVIMGVAKRLGIRLIWGGDFSALVDMPHFELEN